MGTLTGRGTAVLAGLTLVLTAAGAGAAAAAPRSTVAPAGAAVPGAVVAVGPPGGPRWTVRRELAGSIYANEGTGVRGVDEQGVVHVQEYDGSGLSHTYRIVAGRRVDYPGRTWPSVGLPNRAGLSVGSYAEYGDDLEIHSHPMSWVGTEEHPLPLPAGYEGTAVAVNDRGDVLLGEGTWIRQGHDLLTADGTLIHVAVPGWSSLQAFDVNAAGRVLVKGVDGAGATHFALWWPGGVQDLHLPAGATVGRFGPGGHIWGTITDAAGTRAFVRRSGQLRVFPALTARGDARPVAVNRSGVLVGTDRTASGQTVAVRWDQSGSRALPLPAGAASSEASAINDEGWITGSVRGTTAPIRAVLWPGGRPVVLPAAAGQSASGIAVLPGGAVIGTATPGSGEGPWEDVYRWSVFRRP